MSSPRPSYNAPPYYPHYMYQNGYHQQYHQSSPTHLNNHAPVHTPPRMNGSGPSSGPGRGGYQFNRPGPHDYQNYHPLPSRHFVHGTTAATPSPPVSPTYSHPHKPHLTHPPYTHFPSPQNAPYPGPIVWPSEPLSPLPKQLSMLTPLPPSHPAQDSQPAPPSEYLEHSSEPPPEPVLDYSLSSKPSSRCSSPLRSEDDAHVEVTSTSEAEVTTSIESVYVIWSRRPHDPSRAPAIIISPRARPPRKVVHQAIPLVTPPLTPIQSVAEILPNAPLEQVFSPISGKESSAPSPHSMEVQSCSTTETTTSSTAPDTPLAGSPVSSNTSISVSASPGAGVSILSSSPKVEPLVATAHQERPTTEEESLPLAQTLATATSVKKSWASLLRPDGLSASIRGPNALPVSSVVGFSIPGGVETSSNGSIVTDKKQDLLALLTSGPVGPGSVPKINPRGLVNSGNMCFANAVLQVLIYCQPFYRLFMELGKYLSSPEGSSLTKATERKTLLIDATIQFLAEFNPPPNRDKSQREEDERDDYLPSFTPVCIYDAMKEKKRFDNMRGGHQEDAEEFLGFYLDTLEDEFLYILDSMTPFARVAKTASSAEEREEQGPHNDGWLEVGRRNKSVITRTQKVTESPITRIFGGSFRSTLRVPSQKDSAVIETWRSLQLDIQRDQVHSISDALQFISHPQSVQVTSQARPGVTVEASQQVLVETLPSILVLHLKRFLYDTQVGGVVKIGKPISFTPELDIDPELISPARRSHRVKYKLFGVLYHHGLSAAGGHYTLDVLHPHRDLSGKPREAWLRIDDELVSDVLPKDVFHDVDADHRCPYLLFYRRVGSAWSSTSRPQ